MLIPVHSWSSLQPPGKFDALLLGNGASIALHRGFAYRSLLEAAKENGRLPTTENLFSRLDTQDFENVLRVLWHAAMANEALGYPHSHARRAYDEVRNALIATVKQIHCSHNAVFHKFDILGKFLIRFPTIITFSYDLTLYWTILECMSQGGGSFRDEFLFKTNAGTSFDHQWKRKVYNASRVFYAHGCLALAEERGGLEVKLSRNQDEDLLTVIERLWMNGKHVPIFVSEGSSEQKLAAIRRSPYLSSVYHDVLCHAGKHIAVYGLSFGEADDHILDALKIDPPEYIAISVWTGDSPNNQQSLCHSTVSKINRALGTSTKIDFFDSESESCWCHPPPGYQPLPPLGHRPAGMTSPIR